MSETQEFKSNPDFDFHTGFPGWFSVLFGRFALLPIIQRGGEGVGYEGLLWRPSQNSVQFVNFGTNNSIVERIGRCQAAIEHKLGDIDAT